MGMNLTMVHIRGADLEELRDLGLAPTGETISGEEALMPQAPLSVLVRGKDLLLVDPELELADDALELAARVGRRVVVVLIGSTGDVFSLELADGGMGTPGPVAVRHLVDDQGRRVVDQGEPLPEEAGLSTLDEDSVQELFGALTGVMPLSDEVVDGQFQVLGPAPQRPRRGFLARLFGR